MAIITGTIAADTITTSGVSAGVVGGPTTAAADLVNAGTGGDTVAAGGGADTVYGEADGDSLDGGTGNDLLDGGASGDTLAGGDGNDTLIGGLGDDIMTGNAGADTFALTFFAGGSQTDVLADFTAGVDKIDLSGLGIATFAAAQTLLLLNGDGLEMQIQRGSFTTRIVLTGVSGPDLTATDFIYATAVGDESLTGTSSADDLFGGLGNDTLAGGNGTDRLFGEQGDDVLLGDIAVDELYGGDGADSLNGGANEDTLYGDAGADTLDGGNGSDVMLGGDGADVFVMSYVAGSFQTEIIEDFDPLLDRIDVSAFGVGTLSALRALFSFDQTSGLTFTITRNGYTTDMVVNDLTAAQLGAAQLVFSTSLSETAITGGNGRDDLFGGLGNDRLNGGNSGDYLFGEQGADTLLGENGDDTLDGGIGADSLLGGVGLDRLLGGADDDTMDGGGGGGDTMAGGAGADVFRVTFVAGTADTDAIRDFDAAADRIDIGSFGVGTLEALQYVMFIEAGGRSGLRFTRSDFVSTLYVENVATAALGADRFIFSTSGSIAQITGSVGVDNLFGGLGNDRILGGAGNDLLFGEQGNDTVLGDAGTDLVHGGDGNDSLGGGEDRDSLIGGAGADTLDGGTDGDRMTGGAGNDVFRLTYVAGRAQTDLVTDFTVAGDRVDVSSFGVGSFDALQRLLYVFDGGDAGVAIQRGGNFNYMVLQGVEPGSLTAANFVFATATTADVLVGTTSRDDLFGGLGNDSISGGSNSDRLFGEQGNDSLSGDAGSDILEGGTGNDSLAGGDGFNRLDGGAGNDTLTSEDGNDTLIGGIGDDRLTGGAEADLLRGGAGLDWADYSTASAEVGARLWLRQGFAGDAEGDTLQGIENLGGGAFADTLQGDTLANRLSGEGGNDALVGGAGNDTLTGGGGLDEMRGGVGADRFVYLALADAPTAGPTFDTILDFKSGTDKLDLAAIDAIAATPGTNDAFSFIGVAAFSAAGQVRRDGEFLLAEVTGDNVADLQIRLAGSPTFAAGDLIA